MIIKDYDKRVLAQYDNVIVVVKEGENKFVDGTISKVVTCIYFYTLEKELIYKYENWNTYICRLVGTENSRGLNDFIDDLALYIDKCKTEKYWKDKTIDNVINHNSVGLLAIKQFKKEYYEGIQEDIRREKNKQLRQEESNIKEEIRQLIKDISNKELTKLYEPENELKYELLTKYTKKIFDRSPFAGDNINNLNKMIKHLKEYKYYIESDFDPAEFLEFDVVINN